ncbi:HNH endonuclease [Pseudogracilibacillus sp. SE30717A]|uniref:HNH endonuclease n=1 Tax=Pseudogracilibacillus sp. SE30717A TaxID=3098293 RepID=UPI00300E146B
MTTSTMTKKKTETRVCRLCGDKKEIELFEIDSRVKGGRTSRCKACKSSLNDRSRTLYAGLKYRAEQAGQPLEVTRKELQALFATFDGKCIYCGISEEETGESHHVDHVIPVSEGGRHHRSNLVLACASCNASKNNAPFIEFYMRKKDKISDENFNTIVYFISLMSGQPVDEVLMSFIVDYKMKLYSHLSDFISKEEARELFEEVVTEKFKEERAS